MFLPREITKDFEEVFDSIIKTVKAEPTLEFPAPRSDRDDAGYRLVRVAGDIRNCGLCVDCELEKLNGALHRLRVRRHCRYLFVRVYNEGETSTPLSTG